MGDTSTPSPLLPTLQFLARYGAVLGAVAGVCLTYNVTREVTRAFHGIIGWGPYWMFLGWTARLAAETLLLPASIGLLRRSPVAPRLVCLSVLLLLAADVWIWGAQNRNLLSMSLKNWPGVLANLLRKPQELAYPALLVCLLFLHHRVSFIRPGFDVVMPGAGNAPMDDGEIDNVESAAHSADMLLRAVAWIGLIVGTCNSLDFAIKLGAGWIGLRSESGWRFQLLSLLDPGIQVTCVVLAVGSLLVLFSVRAGRTILLAWGVAFLFLQVVNFVLDELMYVFWVATKPTPEPQSATEIAMLGLESHLKGIALAAAVCYFLIWGMRSHQIGIGAGGPAVADPAAVRRTG
jgi:hypothetical protein